MTVVISSYILIAPEGLRLPYTAGLAAGLAFAAVLFALFVSRIVLRQKTP
jgi:hypothetical protein